MKTSNRFKTPLAELQIDLENIFDHWMGGRGEPAEKMFSPRTNVVETEKQFEVCMELPGVGSGDINVEVADNQLVVSGEKRVGPLEEGSKLLRKERIEGTFKRVFEFSTLVDFDKIEASFEAGILSIHVPIVRFGDRDSILPEPLKQAAG